MSLIVNDLSVARGGVPILNGISLTLEQGHALILRGPNGVGKTTVLRTIAGLQPPLAGTIEGAEEQIAYAAHSDGLKSMLTVRENLTFWADVFGAQGVSDALQAFRLKDLSERLAGTLSAGQKRRLGLARLLVAARPIWVLDEPTVSLDAESVAVFAGTVRMHLASGGSALMATHIDLGLKEAKTLDLSPFRARPEVLVGASDEAFL